MRAALLLWFLVSPAFSQVTSEPQYSMPGGNYEGEVAATNQNFLNIAGDMQRLKGSIPTGNFAYLDQSQTFTQGITFSSAVVFSSTITVGPTVFSSSANYSSVNRNGWTIVASTNVTAAASFSFVNLYSSWTHRVGMRIRQNTSDGALNLRINSLSTSIYFWVADRRNSASANADGTSGDVYPLTGSASILATKGMSAELLIRPEYNSDVLRIITQGTFRQADDTTVLIHSGAQVNLTTPMTSINFIPSAGTISGYFWLEAQVPAMGL